MMTSLFERQYLTLSMTEAEAIREAHRNGEALSELLQDALLREMRAIAKAIGNLD